MKIKKTLYGVIGLFGLNALLGLFGFDAFGFMGVQTANIVNSIGMYVVPIGALNWGIFAVNKGKDLFDMIGLK